MASLAASTLYSDVPARYVGGTISFVSPGFPRLPQRLLGLIQQQLDPTVVVASFLRIQADDSGPLYGGQYQQLAGGFLEFLNASAYGWRNQSGDLPIVYGGSFPGGDVPLGEIWVFMSSTGTFHIELY